MAKVSIKSEKITLLGGIFHVRELFSRFVGPVIDKVLGLRCTSFGYLYSEVVEFYNPRGGNERIFDDTIIGDRYIGSLFWVDEPVPMIHGGVIADSHRRENLLKD